MTDATPRSGTKHKAGATSSTLLKDAGATAPFTGSTTGPTGPVSSAMDLTGDVPGTNGGTAGHEGSTTPPSPQSSNSDSRKRDRTDEGGEHSGYVPTVFGRQ